MVVNTKSLKTGIIARTHKSPCAFFITSITYDKNSYWENNGHSFECLSPCWDIKKIIDCMAFLSNQLECEFLRKKWTAYQ